MKQFKRDGNIIRNKQTQYECTLVLGYDRIKDELYFVSESLCDDLVHNIADVNWHVITHFLWYLYLMDKSDRNTVELSVQLMLTSAPIMCHIRWKKTH